MICFGSNSVSDMQTVTKMPGKTNLLSSIELKSIFKNPLTYNSKYSIKEQILLLLKNKKGHFIRSALNITNISLIDRNVQNANNGDGGNDDFNNDDGDIDNEDGDDKNDDGGDLEKFGDGSCTNYAGDDDRDHDSDGGDDEK